MSAVGGRGRVWAKRAFKALALFGAGGLALVVGGGLFLTTATGNRLAKEQILKLAAPFVPGGAVELDDLRFNLVSELSLRGLRLTDAAGAPILSLDRLDLSYDLRGLLDRRLVVHELRVEGTRLNLATDEAGQLNALVALGIGPSPPSTEPARAWEGLGGAIEVEALHVIDLNVVYVDGETQLKLTGLGLDAAASVDQGDVAVRDLHVRGQLVAPGDLPLALDGGLALVADTLSLEQLTLGLGETRAALRGSIAHAQTAPALNLEVDLNARASDVAALAGTSVIREDLAVRLQVDGPLSALELHGDLEALAGRMAVQSTLNLEANPLAWDVMLATDGFALHELVDAVTEETRLAGRYAAKGTGTGWPELPGQTDPSLIDATVRIDGEDQVLWGEPLRDLTLEATVHAGQITITRLNGALAVGTARLSGSVDVPAGTADLSGQVHIGDLSKLTRYGVDGLSGAASWSGAVSVGWLEPELRVLADGSLSAVDLRAPGGVHVGALEVPLDVTVRGEAVTGDGALSLAALSAPGAVVERAEGTWTLDRRASGALEVQVSALRVQGLSAPDADVSMAEATGSATLRLSDSGTPGGDFALELLDLTLPTGVTASGPVSGQLTPDTLQATVDLRAGERPVFRGQVRGDLAGGAWSVDDLALGPTPDALWLADQPVTFTLLDGALSGLDMSMHSEVGGLSATGDLSSASAAVKLGVSELDLAWVSALARRFDASDPLAGLEGALNLEADLHGLAGNGATGTATVKLSDLMMPGTVDAPVDLALALTATDGSLRFEGGLDRGEERWVSVGGDIPMDMRVLKGDVAPRCGEALAARAIIGPVSAQNLSDVVPSVEDAFEQLSADLVLRGDVCDPDFALTLAGTAESGTEDLLMRADLALARGASDLTVRGGLALDGARRVQVDGRARTDLSSVMNWVFRGAPEPALAAPETWLSELELNAVPLSVPLNLLGAPGTMTGTLAGGVQVSGALSDLQVAGGLQWMNGTLGNVSLSMGYFGLEPADGGYDLTAILGFPEGGGLEVTGFIPMHIDVAGDLKGGLDAAMADNRFMLNISDGNNGPAHLPLEALFGGVSGFSEARGDLELSGTVAGSLASPDPDLQLGLYGGAITLASTSVRYDEININAEIVKDRVRIRDLAMHTRPRYGAVLRPGTLSGSGDVALEGFAARDVSLDLTMNDFWVSATPDLNLSMSGDLNARGGWPSLTLGGALAIGQARISRSRDSFLDNASFSLNPDIKVWREGQQLGESKGEAPEFWEGFGLSLALDLNRNLALHVEMPTSTDYGKQFADLSSVTLDADLDGDLAISGTVGAPVLRGVIETVRGEVLLLGAAFTLMPEGEISFAGGDYDNPILKLEAVRATDGYGDVDAIITQHVADLKVVFKADDYPDPADAMALILFGRPSSDLTDSEGRSASDFAAMALASLSGEIERAVGMSAVDQFEIDPTSNAVRVGKALADNLFLSIQLQSGADTSENTAQATVEWMIRRKLYAEFVTGDAGKSSADLYWRWRF